MILFSAHKRSLTIALVGGLLTACSSPRMTLDLARPAADGKTAPDFSMTDAAGDLVKLSDYRGKVVLLNFWTTWCGPCKVETPWFVEFERTYKDRGFAALGVSMDEDGWKTVKPFLTQEAVNYTVVIGSDNLAKLYGGVDSLPTTYLLNRAGKIAFIHYGLARKSEYEAELLKLMAQ